MGCWNKTCGLSNLHITAGSDVYVFILEQNDDTSRCYSTAFYRPLLLPFYSKYNDYGGGEDSHGIALDYIISGLKDELVEIEQGENQYHDIPVKKDSFDIDTFFEAVHEHRLFVKNAWGNRTAVEFVMFRKDVVDDILDTYEVEKYIGDGKGTCGWGNNYIKYKFSDVLADVPTFIDKLEAVLNNEDDSIAKHLQGVSRSVRHLLSFRGLDTVFDYRSENKVAWYMHNDSHQYSRIVNVGSAIVDAVSDGNRKLAEELLSEHIKAQFIDAFISDTRHVWMPGAHEGSQANEHAGYRTLTAAINRALDREKAEWDEEEDE